MIDDQAAFRSLLEPDFESRLVVTGQADSLSLVTFDRNQYSVPTRYVQPLNLERSVGAGQALSSPVE